MNITVTPYSAPKNTTFKGNVIPAIELPFIKAAEFDVYRKVTSATESEMHERAISLFSSLAEYFKPFHENCTLKFTKRIEAHEEIGKNDPIFEVEYKAKDYSTSITAPVLKNLNYDSYLLCWEKQIEYLKNQLTKTKVERRILLNMMQDPSRLEMAEKFAQETGNTELFNIINNRVYKGQ